MIGAIAFDHGDDPALVGRLTHYQRTTLEDIAACGTPACGLHEEVCDTCGDRRQVPNTCGNRSCPHCQGRQRAAWVSARMGELLLCSYFHVVLTLPSELRDLAKAYPRVILNALLVAAGDAIQALCRNPKHLGAEVGMLEVLHTWRRDLGYHPHVHIIVTAGGWDDQHQRWIPARRYGPNKRQFLLPVDPLRAAFKHRLTRLILDAYDDGKFTDGADSFPVLASRVALAKHLKKIQGKTWCIRIEPPFGGPSQLLKYLGAYVNRVAISPQRITAYDPEAGTVTYTWCTNAEPDQTKQATIPAVEFLRRFAQHILPPGFQRIRFRGLWCTAHRTTKLKRVQAILGTHPIIEPEEPSPPPPPPEDDPTFCHVCGKGHYQRIGQPYPRPCRSDRRKTLRELRKSKRTPTPTEATTPA
jgi:hypothetical protein